MMEKVTLVVLCYNEEEVLPYFMKNSVGLQSNYLIISWKLFL